MTERPEVSMKDTKKTILNAYEDALDEINELKSQQFNPVELRDQELNDEAVGHVDTMSWDLNTVFGTMRKSIDTNLRSMQMDLEHEKEELDKVRRAKDAINAELSALYGISAQAQSLAALVQAQKTKKEEHDTYIRAQREALDADITAHEETLTNEKLVWVEEKKKKEQEWEYNFKRECKRQADEFNDSLIASRKEWLDELEKQNKDLAERREEVAKQEKEVLDLKEQVAKFPERLAEAEVEAKKKAKQAYDFETQALKRNYEADIKVLTHEVNTLTKARDDLSEKVANLEAKLEGAYGNIQNVASKALEAQGNATIVAEVQRAAASASAGKGK